MYQMYAYGKQYDVSLVILIYPRTEDLSGHVAEYCHWLREREEGRTIRVVTVDVSTPLGRPDATMPCEVA